MSAFGGGGLFGSSNTQQQQQQQQGQQQQPGQSGGLFGGLGSTTSNAPGQTGGGLFGNLGQTQGQNQPGGSTGASGAGTGGGLFGGQSTTQQGSAGGGLFGGQQQQQQQPSGGLFGGGSTTQQPATGGLFGGASTQQPQPGGGLFGGTTQQQQQPSGGLFGGGTQQQQQQPSGGLFGSSTTQQPATGGGLFGSTTQQPSTGGGLFGSTMRQPQPQPELQPQQQAGGGPFGTAPSTSTTGGGGLFGAPSSGLGGGLFGSTAQQQQQQQQPATLFGQPQVQQPQQPGLLGGSLFGGAKSPLGTSGGLFSSRAVAVPAQQQQDAQTQFTQLAQRIQATVEAWSPDSPNNRFQHYFYNLVDPAQVQLYGRPTRAQNETLWQKALRENPDPKCCVPVLASSFDDLKTRVDAQGQQAQGHQEKLKDLRARIEKLAERHELSNASRLHKASSVQTQLTQRLLKLVQHLHLLIPALRSSAIRPEEEAMRAALEDIDGEIRRPGGMGRIVGKLNELWALVGALNAMRGNSAKGGSEGLEWAVVDEDGLNQIVQILAEEQAGLVHLTTILQKDLKDVAVVYGEEEPEEETKPRTDLLTSFSQTLRGSTLR